MQLPVVVFDAPEKGAQDRGEVIRKALCQLPTIGPKTAERLVGAFGETMLENMLADNIYEFINLAWMTKVSWCFRIARPSGWKKP